MVSVWNAKERKVIIVGGGIVGLHLARRLAERDVDVDALRSQRGMFRRAPTGHPGYSP